MRDRIVFAACIAMTLGVPAAGAACLDPQSLETLRRQETDYLLGRVPPAFRHAVEDGKLHLAMAAAEGEGCRARVTFTLPSDELADAARILDADPAKRIMLASQGYGLPETASPAAEFTVDPANLAVSHQDTLQVAALGRLRASVELMYATLSQARAAIDEHATNAAPWGSTFRERQVQGCVERMSADGEAGAACTCKVDALAAAISERQMEYQLYVRSNPYAKATGAGRTFAALEQRVEQRCGLKRRS